ncbi:hypothetical protein SAMN05428969_0065 [Devosia sp. YR412]|uniref:hypothetical protein n=1 Tax=Devosia sp. YR412 TaxID=1881030 RepID=UPI0008AD35AE|nr:hypothetical protein [Devosia sp. YR412]SEP60078.1 hypothetical protein SAMN05428969_0065 [Devosia sp. YR412]
MSKANPTTSHSLAERHEALWLRLSALHKDLAALAGRRSGQTVGAAIRISAEALLADCAPFADGQKLPVAAEDAADLLVQLGQALARLDAYEAQHSFWDNGKKCRSWRVRYGELPVQRLRPELPPPPKTYDGEDMRSKLATMTKRRWQAAFEDGFRAGQAARRGPPDPVRATPPAEIFSPDTPRIRRFD